MPRPATDLKFLETNPYIHDDDAILASVVTQQLHPPVRSFLVNTCRLQRLLAMASDITGVAAKYGYVQGSTRQSGIGTDDAIAGADYAMSIMQKIDPTLSESRENGDFLLTHIIKSTGTALAPAFEAVLIAQITGAWTACETLFGDLWETALNFHPETLANLSVGHKVKLSKDDDDDTGSSTILLKDIARYRFDISGSMGSLLRGKMKFDRLDRTRVAYHKAFDDVAVRAAIDDDALLYLSKLRNVIIHKAGFADKEFCNAVSGHALLSKITKDTWIEVDGEIVMKTVPAALSAALALIRSVDDWMVNNPKRKEVL